jgi:hypothetical protein
MRNMLDLVELTERDAQGLGSDNQDSEPRQREGEHRVESPSPVPGFGDLSIVSWA